MAPAKNAGFENYFLRFPDPACLSIRDMPKRSMKFPSSSAAALRRDAAIPVLPTPNAALKEIANRIVTQQLAAVEPKRRKAQGEAASGCLATLAISQRTGQPKAAPPCSLSAQHLFHPFRLIESELIFAEFGLHRISPDVSRHADHVIPIAYHPVEIRLLPKRT